MDPSSASPTVFLVPLVRGAPPWLMLSALTGIVSAAAFFVFAGRGFRSLPTYLLLGMLIAPLCQAAIPSLATVPAPLSVGEVNLVAVAGGTWAFLLIARLLRL